MPKTAAIFDLDGTLLDSLKDIADSANATLEHYGFPTHSDDSYRVYVGDGITNLARRVIPSAAVTDKLVEEFVVHYRKMYEARWDKNTRPFPGIEELLDNLTSLDVPLAVLSNKRDDFTKKCVGTLLSKWSFAVVRGEQQGVPLKPDPTALIKVAEELSVPVSQCVYIGDSEIDIEVGKRAGMFDVGVTWGFRPKSILEEYSASVIVDSPAQVVEILMSRRAAD